VRRTVFACRRADAADNPGTEQSGQGSRVSLAVLIVSEGSIVETISRGTYPVIARQVARIRPILRRKHSNTCGS
jgi:hypothetical protein